FHVTGVQTCALPISVRQLSVLVGANGVGKTNLYRALELARAAATGELSHAIAREGGLGSVMWAGERRAKEAPRMVLRIGLDDVLDRKSGCRERGQVS